MAGLLDFIQSASNSAAGNVSAPVDGIAWLLRKAGIPVPDAPMGGSDWMQQRGLTRPVQQSGASLAGETMSLLGPIGAAAKAPQIARGLLAMGENASIPSTMANQGQRGMLLYHGTDTKQPLTEILPRTKTGAVADGLFASGSKSSAGGHGRQLYRMTILDHLVHPAGSMDTAIADAGSDGARAYAALLDRVGGDARLAEVAINDRGLERLLPNRGEFGAEASDIAANELRGRIRDTNAGLGDGFGALSWELQNQRGLLAKDLGFKAVAVADEHGLSYLIPSGAGVRPRPYNKYAKANARGTLGDLHGAEKAAEDAQLMHSQQWAADKAAKSRAETQKTMDAINSLPGELREKALELKNTRGLHWRRAEIELREILARNGQPIK